jgi:hypothetical protein
MLLQALLNGHIIAHLLPTKPLRISPAGRLLLRRTHMTLGK